MTVKLNVQNAETTLVKIGPAHPLYKRLTATQRMIIDKLNETGRYCVSSGLHRGQGGTGKLRSYGTRERNAALKLIQLGLVRVLTSTTTNHHTGPGYMAPGTETIIVYGETVEPVAPETLPITPATLNPEFSLCSTHTANNMTVTVRWKVVGTEASLVADVSTDDGVTRETFSQEETRSILEEASKRNGNRPALAYAEIVHERLS